MQSTSRPGPLLIVGGPTASGKSGLALRLAETFGGWIVNADSMQVYRDLDILAARPSMEDLARVPHRLYGVLDAADLCSAARWRVLALDAIAEARAAGAIPIVVGGTGLYLRALLDGLADMPEIPPDIREAARALHREIGGVAFRERLAMRDPQAAERLNPGDSQRLVRAYEIVAATGVTIGDWQRRQDRVSAQTRAATLGAVAPIVLLPPREALYAACDARFAGMVARGGLDEARAIIARRLDPALPAMKAVGLPELARHLAGEIDLDEAIAAGQQATRRYAKRQYTWFRHQIRDAFRVETQFSESTEAEIFSFIRRFLLTSGTVPV